MKYSKNKTSLNPHVVIWFFFKFVEMKVFTFISWELEFIKFSIADLKKYSVSIDVKK